MVRDASPYQPRVACTVARRQCRGTRMGAAIHSRPFPPQPSQNWSCSSRGPSDDVHAVFHVKPWRMERRGCRRQHVRRRPKQTGRHAITPDCTRLAADASLRTASAHRDRRCRRTWGPPDGDRGPHREIESSLAVNTLWGGRVRRPFPAGGRPRAKEMHWWALFHVKPSAKAQLEQRITRDEGVRG